MIYLQDIVDFYQQEERSGQDYHDNNNNNNKTDDPQEDGTTTATNQAQLFSKFPSALGDSASSVLARHLPCSPTFSR